MWPRGLGWETQKTNHGLRAYAGSQIAMKYGIYEAQTWLGLLFAFWLGATVLTAILGYAKANRLEHERGLVWQEGYMEGIRCALKASQDQITHLSQSGSIDYETMRRIVLDSRTNNPYGVPITK
jgi:hypothetical protein